MITPRANVVSTLPSITPSVGVVSTLPSPLKRLLKDECVCQEQQMLSGKEVKVLGDNCCLFHAMAHGLGDGVTHTSLRTQTVAFIKSHPNHELHGSPLSDWIEWEKAMTVTAYCDHMSKPDSWGGAIEEAVIAHTHGLNVIVGTVRSDGLFHPRYRFNASSAASKDVHLAYNGTDHYNAFEASGPISSAATAALKLMLGVLSPPPSPTPPPTPSRTELPTKAEAKAQAKAAAAAAEEAKAAVEAKAEVKAEAEAVEAAEVAKALAAVEAEEAAEAVADAEVFKVAEAYEVAEAEAASEAKAVAEVQAAVDAKAKAAAIRMQSAVRGALARRVARQQTRAATRMQAQAAKREGGVNVEAASDAVEATARAKAAAIPMQSVVRAGGLRGGGKVESDGGASMPDEPASDVAGAASSAPAPADGDASMSDAPASDVGSAASSAPAPAPGSTGAVDDVHVSLPAASGEMLTDHPLVDVVSTEVR